MPEAVARVQRAAGEIAGQVQGLGRDTASLLDQLGQVDPMVRRAAETLERYREQLRQGSALNEAERENFGRLTSFVNQRGGQAGQNFLMREAAQAPDLYQPRPLSEPDKDSRRQQQRADGSPAYTEDQLAGARYLEGIGGVTLIPPPRPSVGAAAPANRPSPQPGGPTPQPFSAEARPVGGEAVRPQPEEDAETRRAARGVVQVLDERTDRERALAFQKRASALTEQDLRREWTETTRALREQQRDLETSTQQFSRLTDWRERGFISRREEAQLDTLPARIRDLQAGLRQFELERQALATEAERRGGGVDEAGRMELPEGMNFRKGLMAFAGGAGFGGGGPMGLAVGVAGGALSLELAALAGAGMALGYAWRFASHGAEAYEGTQRRIFDAHMQLGGGAENLRAGVRENLRSPLRVRLEETIGAQLALATQTGRTDAQGIIEFARAYGLPIPETAQQIGGMGALGFMPRGTVERETVTRMVPDEAAQRQRETLLASRFPDKANPRMDAIAESSSHFRAILDLTRRTTSDYRESEVDLLRRELERTTDPARRGQIETQIRKAGAFAESDLMPVPMVRRTETVEHRRGDLAGILGAAYRRSAYEGLPEERRDALMQSFLTQTERLLQVQAGGGAPIAEDAFGRMPAMLSKATHIFGPEIAPRFGAELTGTLVQGLTQPQNEVQRGIQMRAILDLGRRMSPEQLANFRAATEKQVPGGGIDPTTYMGAQAAMQNAAALPPAQGTPVLRAMLEGMRSNLGRGAAGEMFFTQMAGGNAAQGILLNRLAEKLLATAPGTTEESKETDNYRKALAKKEAAGDEAAPFELDARTQERALAAGKDLKLVGQSINESLLDFVDQIMGARRAWESGVSSSEAVR